MSADGIEKVETESRWVFDQRRVDHVVQFFSKFLIHFKGKQAGQPFHLLPWQIEKVITPIYGWYDRVTGERKHKHNSFTLPKKAGKSMMCSGICIYELIFGESGGEVYFVATTREQATILFGMCYNLILNSPILKKKIHIFKKEISYAPKKSVMRVLCNSKDQLHGRNPSCIIYDETHTAPDSEAWDILCQSMTGRKSPIAISITHAGHNPECFAYRLQKYTEDVNAGIIKDDRHYGVVYSIDPSKENWEDPAVWIRVNPSVGSIVTMEELLEDYQKAKNFPEYERDFRVYRLNEWLRSDKSFVDDKQWMACIEEGITPDDFIGEDCWLAVDMSSVSDLTCVAQVFKKDDRYYAFVHTFCPTDNILYRSEKDKVPYTLWESQGHLIGTPGNATDDEAVLQKIFSLAENFNVVSVAFDRWNALSLINKCMEKGVTAVAHGQGFISMSAPTKKLEKMIFRGTIRHSGDPVLRWCIGNVRVTTDAAGNHKPAKDKSIEKIDPVVALIMAIGQAAANDEADTIATVMWA